MRDLLQLMEGIDPTVVEDTELDESYMLEGGAENFREMLVTAVQDGELDAMSVVEMFARWNTSDDIKDMLLANDIFLGDGYSPYEDEGDDFEEGIATTGVRG